MFNCALISADEGFRHIVLGLLRQSGTQARLAVDLQIAGDELKKEEVEKILATHPRVVFLDLGEDPMGVGGVQVLSQEAPDMSLVVAGPALDAEGLLAVMRAGAGEYLPRPLSPKETEEAFARVRRRTRSTAVESDHSPGRVLTVFSAKGGTGVTTVATNLAVGLEMVTDSKRVLLLDAVPSLGTTAVGLGLQPRYSFLDVIQNFHRIDEELFKSFMDVHESGITLLASPAGPTGMSLPSPDEVHDLILLCKQHFDYVVIDGGNYLSEYLLSLLQESDDRILVVTPELASLRNLKQALDLYGRMDGKPPPKIVLNRYETGVGLDEGDVEDGLGHHLATVLEKDDLRMLESVNLGRPEVQAGRSRFARSLTKFARSIAGVDETGSSRSGLLGRLFKRSTGPSESGKEKG